MLNLVSLLLILFISNNSKHSSKFISSSIKPNFLSKVIYPLSSILFISFSNIIFSLVLFISNSPNFILKIKF